jgi:Spy/CpxP family protein refolding chaperone
MKKSEQRKQKQRKAAREKLGELVELLKKPNADTLELQAEYLEAVETAVEVLEEQGY